MNKGFYPNLDTNFEQAYELCGKNFSHDELLDLLQNGNIPQKQIAAIKFDYVATKCDACALLDNLTGCDGKIREAVAMKINKILETDEGAREIFAGLSGDVFAKAAIDINGNICRLILESANFLKSYSEFSQIYAENIFLFAKQALTELDKFIFRDKKYVINKQLFKLYWCLETLKDFYNFIPELEMIEILEKCAVQDEYTIREKAAQIALLSHSFNHIAEKLKQDDNYYVRTALNHPSTFK